MRMAVADPDRRVRARRPPGDHGARSSRSSPTRPLLEAANRIWTRPSMESRIDDAVRRLRRRAGAPPRRRDRGRADRPTRRRAAGTRRSPTARPTSTSSRSANGCGSASASTACCTTRRRRRRNVLRPMVSRLKVMAGCDIAEQPHAPRTAASR